MRKFFLGFVVGIAVIVLTVLIYVRFGFVDPRADIGIDQFERDLAMPSLDAAMDRRAPEIKNPIEANNVNLVAGMKVYQTNCAICHGDIRHPHGPLAESFYPRAPQFVEDPPDMPENQNFYIVQHGVRLSGMPAWKKNLNEHEMWQVTAFLSHMDKLPPIVSQEWKNVAHGTPSQPPSSDVAAQNHTTIKM